jgi:hypothetical protein
MKRRGLMIALALIVLVNIIVLAGVNYNRTGEPDATVTLTERELHLVSSKKENSGVSLKLELQAEPDKPGEGSYWFDRKKLEEVGFDCSKSMDASDASDYYDRVLPRKTYVVLEYEGTAWKLWQAGREKQLRALEAKVAEGREERKTLDTGRKRFKWELEGGSRLFAVDAGNDPARLRQRYTDRTRYVITPALVRLNLLRVDAAEKQRKPVLVGYVREILTDEIHVPRDRQGILASLKPAEYYSFYDDRKDNFAPRYTVKLTYGRRYEPWVEQVMKK